MEDGDMSAQARLTADLDERIADAFTKATTSADVAGLIEEAQSAAVSSGEAADAARTRALDPALSAADVAAARRDMEDAAFRRDRMQEAVRRLGDRLREVRKQEDQARRRVAYDAALAERDALASELADVYPAIAEKLADIVGRIAAATTRVPVVSSLVNLAYGPEHFADPSAPTWRLRAAQALDVATARLTVRMHAVSARVADVMAPRLLYPRSRIDVVVRGRDAATLGTRDSGRRARARAQLGVDDSEQLVLTVAREEHQKGLDVLLEAVAVLRTEMPTARTFVAARRGTQSEVLAAMVERLDLGSVVTFLGTRDDVADLLCAADVFVLPSRREGLPGAVVEAMAMQAPIVASDGRGRKAIFTAFANGAAATICGISIGVPPPGPANSSCGSSSSRAIATWRFCLTSGGRRRRPLPSARTSNWRLVSRPRC
jgi:glycosyltransferase involved in cell wall biosynthesis